MSNEHKGVQLLKPQKDTEENIERSVSPTYQSLLSAGLIFIYSIFAYRRRLTCQNQ